MPTSQWRCQAWAAAVQSSLSLYNGPNTLRDTLSHWLEQVQFNDLPLCSSAVDFWFTAVGTRLGTVLMLWSSPSVMGGAQSLRDWAQWLLWKFWSLQEYGLKVPAALSSVQTFSEREYSCRWIYEKRARRGRLKHSLVAWRSELAVSLIFFFFFLFGKTKNNNRYAKSAEHEHGKGLKCCYILAGRKLIESCTDKHRCKMLLQLGIIHIEITTTHAIEEITIEKIRAWLREPENGGNGKSIWW